MSNEMAVLDTAETTLTPKQSVFMSPSVFEHSMRMADYLAKADIIPQNYKNKPANIVIAMDMAMNMGISPITVMANSNIIEGRFGWSAEFTIAMINSHSNKFACPLRFDVKNTGKTCEVTYKYYTGPSGARQQKETIIKVPKMSCTAWTVEKGSNEKLIGSEITTEMAVKEGWWTKGGSKWPHMTEQMLRYRSATFFARIYCPEVLQGMRTVDEIIDVEFIDVTPSIVPPASVVSTPQAYEKKQTGDVHDAIDISEPKKMPKIIKPGDGTPVIPAGDGFENFGD